MPSIDGVAKQFFETFWQSFRGPMLERGAEGLTIVLAVIWVVIRARSFTVRAWNDILQVIAPFIWLLSILLIWHLVKTAFIIFNRTPNDFYRAEIAVLTVAFLFIPALLISLTWLKPDPNAPRHLTDAQKEVLISALAPYKGQKYAINYAPNSAEVLGFEHDFEEVFTKAGWLKAIYGPLWAPIGFPDDFRFPNQFGVQWYIADRAPKNSVYSTLRTVLRERCGIVADGVRWPDPQMRMDMDVIYVYVGSKFQQ
jgi:hypothetical protein